MPGPQQKKPKANSSPHRRHVAGKDIVIYPNRKQAILRTILGVVCLVFLILLLVLIIFALSLTFSSPLPASILVPGILLLVCLLAIIYFAGRATWRMASTVLFARDPMLVINHQGVTVARTPTLDGYFIPWAEIESIYLYNFMYKFLCIHPKNTDQYLARFNGLERFIRRSNARLGVPPLAVAQIFLERPVAGILQQVKHNYASELSHYRIQILT